jgi:hypothetical protein
MSCNKKVSEFHQCAGTEVLVITEFDVTTKLDALVKLNLEVNIHGEEIEDFLEDLSSVICFYEK